MDQWDLNAIDVEPRHPQILSSTDEGRAIVVQLPAGEELQEHEVHERAWIHVVSGELEVSTPAGESTTAGAGQLLAFAPQERRTVRARSDARLLMVLTPWPGDGHPGAMTLEDKGRASGRRAREQTGVS